MLGNLKKKIRQATPDWLINLYHLARGVLAAYRYGHPSKKMRIIGVTGTNGKTTTCHLITSVLEAGHRPVGMITTVGFKINGRYIENNLKMTTPSPFLVQKLLRQMADAGCQDVVLEVTSIGLMQHRLWGIKFDTAVFTNLTHDHLDYHGSMEQYRLAKEKLFEGRPALSVINGDDPVADHFTRHTANKTLIYSIKNRGDVMAKKVYARPGGTDFVLLIEGRQATVNLPLPGTFNVYNALAAAAVGLGSGLSLETVIMGLHAVTGVPGRMEVVDEGQAFTTIVDYAHTPDAMMKVYETVKPTVRGKMIVVFGATGERDKAKRPILGAIAGKFADYVIVTTDDPYGEDPHTIIDEVAEGVPRGRPNRGGRLRINKDSEIPIKYKDSGEDIWWWRIPDRKAAIAKALEMARPQDVVLVLGKGAEKVMVTKDGHIPWSDRGVLEELLKNYQVR